MRKHGYEPRQAPGCWAASIPWPRSVRAESNSEGSSPPGMFLLLIYARVQPCTSSTRMWQRTVRPWPTRATVACVTLLADQLAVAQSVRDRRLGGMNIQAPELPGAETQQLPSYIDSPRGEVHHSHCVWGSLLPFPLRDIAFHDDPLPRCFDNIDQTRRLQHSQGFVDEGFVVSNLRGVGLAPLFDSPHPQEIASAPDRKTRLDTGDLE